MGEWIAQARSVTKTFCHRKAFEGQTRLVRAVDSIDLSIRKGSVMGLVGESGCGKSTVGKLLVGLLKPDSGDIFFRDHDLTGISSNELQALRKDMQIIFQDPADSFDPRYTVERIVTEGYDRFNHSKAKKWKNEKISEVFEAVRLRKDMKNRYPHELSGGERQRVGIARSLILGPAFIVCDEPVSSLDVSVQAEILNLLIEIKKEKELTYLFISHDLSVVEYICTDVAVMYLGRMVEKGTKKKLFSHPFHPYTQGLLVSVPVLRTRMKEKKWKPVAGDIPDPARVPSGCPFHPRCPYKMDICSEEKPVMKEIGEGHSVACHLSEK